MMRISVIGAGKMGLPLVCHFAARGGYVFAVDRNPDVVAALNRGECTIDEPGVPESLQAGIQAGRIQATTDIEAAVAESDVAVVIVPAVLTDNGHADLSILENVSRQIGRARSPGLVVSYETTVPVGTTRKRFVPLLREQREDVPLYVVYSPERVKSLRVMDLLTRTPKIIGGENEEAARRGVSFYSEYLGAPVVNVNSLEGAEYVKLASMLYRDVNIGLANQIARYTTEIGLDYMALIDAVNTDPEAHMLAPGIGVGGHCTPIYPYFFIHHAEEHGLSASFNREARAVNDGQSEYAVSQLEEVLGSLEGTSVLILGLGFRPGVKEHICSPAFLLKAALEGRGAEVKIHDPLYNDDEIRTHGFEPGALGDEAGYAAVVLNTRHAEYNHLDFAGLKKRGLRAVFDGRTAWNPETIRRLGIIYLGIGRPRMLPESP